MSSDAAGMTPLLPQPTTPLLPKGQLLAVYAIKLIVPITSFQILPFVNEMVARAVGRPPSEVGYYSGLVSTAYTIANIVTVYPWARLSDWIGRIPVIVTGMLGLAISSLLFGTSDTLFMIIFTRFLIGVFAGIVGVLHSVVGELADEASYSTAFPFYDVVAAVGFIVGPLIGGNLSNPARYPALDYPFLRLYPFVLPCAIASVLSVCAALLGAFFLRETNARRSHTTVVAPPDYEALEATITPTPPPLTVQELLAFSSLRAVCIASGAVGMIATAFNSIVVLVAYTPTESGGLSMSSSQIALALSVTGAISIVLKLTLPILLKRMTTILLFRVAMLAWIPTYGVLGLLPILARNMDLSAIPIWIGLGIVLFLSRVGCLAFSLKLILVREHTPDTSALGAANGLSELAENLGSVLGPAPLSALFAASATHGLLGGYLWAIIAAFISAACVRLVDKIQDMPVARDRRDD